MLRHKKKGLIMDNFYELVKTRRSIRKFEDTDIPDKDIEYFIKAAVTAPSGCNSQCWDFVAVKNKAVIQSLADAVGDAVEETLGESSVSTKEYIDSKKKGVGFFSKAPLVIAVFMTEAGYYDKTFLSYLDSKGYDHKQIMDYFGNYDVLSIGAAVQNLLLAVHSKGYGACWMNDPVIAGNKVNQILGVPENHKFISLIPIGVPAYTPRDKKMKALEEIFKIIK